MGKKDKIKKFNRLLTKYRTKKNSIKILRTTTEGENELFGIILKFSKELMQVATLDDFRLDGEVLIKMDHFDSIRCNSFDKTYKRILQKEKTISKKKPKRTSIDLSNWRSAFENLMKYDIHVIVECEDLKHPTFTIGPIEQVNKKSVDIRYYDPTGQLEKKLTRIKYKHITKVQFNDDYSKTFRKYLKNAR